MHEHADQRGACPALAERLGQLVLVARERDGRPVVPLALVCVGVGVRPGVGLVLQ